MNNTQTAEELDRLKRDLELLLIAGNRLRRVANEAGWRTSSQLVDDADQAIREWEETVRRIK